jgi:adenylate cyclase
MAIDSKKPVVSHNISEMIQFKDFIARQQEEYFNTGKIAPEIPSFGQSITTLSIESVIVVPLFEGENIIGLLWLDNRKGNKAFTETDFYLSVAISSLIQLQLLYDRHKSIALLQSNMERFFSPKTLEWLKKRTSVGKEVKLSVRECDVSILYVDIVDSTRLAKELTPRAFFEHLTPHYYETMSEAIFAFDGHVDDFMGDGIMAIFGDVLGIDEKKEIPKAKYAINAVSAALRMVNHWPIIVKEKHLPEVMKIRIGIHSGRAVVGSVGYEKRMEFTALGKDVNIASRLEKFAEPNGIVISDQTYQLVKDKFQCEDLGEKEIKGITEGETGKLRLWKVVGEKK